MVPTYYIVRKLRIAISDEKISKTDIVEQIIRECIKIDTFLFRNKQIIKIKLFL